MVCTRPLEGLMFPRGLFVSGARRVSSHPFGWARGDLLVSPKFNAQLRTVYVDDLCNSRPSA
jgi:hypothetical protein